MQQPSTLTIHRRFNGPPNSANGGWAAGTLAKHLNATSISVSLRAPPPLDVPLSLHRPGDGSIALMNGDTLLAQAQAVEFDVKVPTPPNLAEAQAVGAKALALGQNRPSWPYARCFGCGALRHDGLRITPGPIGTTGTSGTSGIVAAGWTPDPSLADGEPREAAPRGVYRDPDRSADRVRVEAVWTSLDCIAGIAWSLALPELQPMVTARIMARIDERPRIGESYIVMGWPIERDGRKLQAGSALIAADGRVLAKTLQLWLLPREAVPI